MRIGRAFSPINCGISLGVCPCLMRGSKDKGSKDRGSKDRGSKDKGSKDKGSKDRGCRIIFCIICEAP